MLKLEVKDKKEIPAGFEAAYEEKDGVFKLKLEDQVVPKSKLDEFRNNNIELQKQIDVLKTEQARFQGVDPVKFKEYAEQIQKMEDKKLIDAGEIDKLVDKRVERMKADFEGQSVAQAQTIEQLKTTNFSLATQLETVLIDSQIQQAVNDTAAARPGAMQDILHRGRRLFKLVEGKVVPLGPDNKPIYGKDGKAPMTFTEWAESLVREAPYLFEANKGGGGRGGGSNQPPERIIQGGDPLTFGQNLEAIAAGKVEVQ
jgi:hypothetical protein